MKTRNQPRGQAMVEFALVIPIFLLIIFGILDLGRAVYAYSTLNNASREGARLAMVDQTLTHIEDVASAHAVGLGVSVNDVVVEYRSAEDPDVACTGTLGTSEAVGCTAIVTVNYVFTAATPLIGTIVGNIRMAGESSVVVQFPCQEPTTAQCPVGE